MKLNFLIIGAQKSATTALFKYLQGHPFLAMPEAKEVPLFTNDIDDCQARKFVAEHFEGQIGKLRGKATPQYMCDERIPERIYNHNSDMRLIAVLRDPIDRAWSHYRMNKRREAEVRDFEQAMLESLQTEVLKRGRRGSPPLHEQCFESEADYYLPWGEYGRILDRYLEYFSRDQLLVIYTSELQGRPGETLDKILAFLGLQTGYRPDCLGEVVHKGGSEKILSKQTLDAVRDFWPVNQIWARLPERRKDTLRYWFEQLNVKAKDEEMILSETTRKRLQSHFAEDAKRLSQITGTSPLWA